MEISAIRTTTTAEITNDYIDNNNDNDEDDDSDVDNDKNTF